MGAQYYTRQGDVGAPIQDILEDSSGSPKNLSGATGVFKVDDRFGHSVFSGAISNWSDGALDPTGEVAYVPLTADVANVGTFFCSWTITFASGAIETWPNDGTQSFLVITPELA